MPSSCQASSQLDSSYPCDNTYPNRSGEWATLNEASGAWILFSFQSPVDVVRVSFTQNSYKTDSERAYFPIRDVGLAFSDGSHHSLTLSDANQYIYTAIDVTTVTWVRVDFLTTYTDSIINFGIEEIVFYGFATTGIYIVLFFHKNYVRLGTCTL